MHSDSSATTLLYRRHQQRPKSTSRQHKIPNIRLGKKLGTGSFSEVFHGIDVKEKREVAVKVVDPSKMNPMLRHNLQNEIEIMKTIRDVEGTIQLFDVIQLDSSPLVFLVMELAKETLMEYLLRRKKAFSEEEARDVFVQLAKTLNTLHQRNIVHRDIKLENIYISLSKESLKRGKKSNKLILKLGDFGFATLVTPDKKLEQYCGTPIYAAPEIVSGSPYDGKKVDVWSLGIVLYAMLCGRFPFMVNKPTVSDSEFYRLLFNKIQNKKLHFSRKVILSAEVKDLLNRMLDKNPFTRITMKEVLIHPWVQNRRLQIQPNKEKKKKKKKRTFLSRTTSLTTSHCIKNHSFEQEHCDNKQKNRQLSASGILATRHRAHDIIVKQFVKDHSDNSSKKSAPSQQQQQQQQQQQHSKQERSCTHFLKTSKETDR